MKEAAALHPTAPAVEPVDTIRLSGTAETIAKTLASLPARKAASAQSWQDEQRERNAIAARLAANRRASA